MTSPFRIAPNMPAHAYKTYELRAPAATHYRPARCEEVDCAWNARGWATAIDVSTELGAKQANYIRLHSGRSFTTGGDPAGALIFRFPAGQQCFAQHQLPLEREPLYVVRGGDWRAHLGRERQHVHAADWVDDFATHQQAVADQTQKG